MGKFIDMQQFKHLMLRAFKFAEKSEDEVARDLTIGQVWSQVDSQVWDDGYWVHDIYAAENNALYAITSRGGKLYQFPLEISDGAVTMGEAIEVEHSFTPVATETRMFITRQADGRRRLTVIASTAVLNRVGQIDSRDLYDDFIKNREAEGNPYWTILHTGEVCRFGEIDFLFRDEYVYVNSGLLDDGNFLADLVADAVDRISNGELDLNLGISIGFTPTAPPTYEEIAPNVKVPVYRSGIHRESSVLLEETAAALFTNIVNVERKRTVSKALEGLLSTLGLPADKVSQVAGQVDDTNREIQKPGMIARSTDAAATPAPAVTPAAAAAVVTPAATPAPAPAVAATPEPVAAAATETPAAATPAAAATVAEATTLEVSDELLGELVEKIAPAVTASIMKSMELVVNQSREAARIATEAQERVATLTTQLNEERSARQTAEQRLGQLEAPEDEKRRNYQADMPRKQTVVVTRARVERDGTVSQVADMAAQASATLSKMPKAVAVSATPNNGGL